MNPTAPESPLAAEARARVLIDGQLTAAGWAVQDGKQLNLFAGQGIARREAIMATGHGRADYLLYVDRKVVGVIEAKPVGRPLSGVEWQSAMYATGLPNDVRLSALTHDGRLPFVFEASGSETHFTNGYDPAPRARRIFSFPDRGYATVSTSDRAVATQRQPALSAAASRLRHHVENRGAAGESCRRQRTDSNCAKAEAGRRVGCSRAIPAVGR